MLKNSIYGYTLVVQAKRFVEGNLSNFKVWIKVEDLEKQPYGFIRVHPSELTNTENLMAILAEEYSDFPDDKQQEVFGALAQLLMQLKEQEQGDKPYIGYSLSMCIGDIIMGSIPLNEVNYIIASTRIDSEQEFQRVLAENQQTFWDMEPEKAEQVMRQLFAEGRIDQPKLHGLKTIEHRDNYWSKAGKPVILYPNEEV